MKIFVILLFMVPVFPQAQMNGEKLNKPSVQQQVWSLTEVMYHDVVNPPAAARFYSYSMLTGYEIISQLDNNAPQIQKVLNQYPKLFFSFDPSKINKELAALYGILETGKNIIPSGYLLEDRQKLLKQVFQRKKLKAEIIDSSIVFAQRVSKQIVQYCKTDGYFKLSTLARYKPFESDSSWKPTPPEYMAAVEPHWQTIRTFFVDSAKQFRALPPIRFDTTRS